MVTAEILRNRLVFKPSLIDGLFLSLVFFAVFAWLIYYAPSADFLVSSVDQGSQMILGIALLDGKVQGVDIIWLYGPLVGWASALGIEFAPGYTGEIIICAFGYATSITLVAAFLVRRVPLLATLTAVILLAMLLSRFYKWYYWFFPLLQLLLCLEWRSRLFQAQSELGVLLIWGLSGGIAFFFRPDLGALSIGLFAAAYTVLIIEERRFVFRAAAVRFCAYVFGFLLVHAVWLLLYGVKAWFAFITSFVAGLASAVVDVGHGTPALRVSFTPQSTALLIVQVALPVLATAAIWKLLRDLVVKGVKIDPYRSAILGAALLSIGVFPQAMHRADAQHLLQVIPPFIIFLTLLAFAPKIKLTRRLLVALMLPPLVVVAGAGRTDLYFGERNFQRYWAMVAGLPGSFRDHPSADMAAAIIEHTNLADSIYVPMRLTPSPILVMARRHMPGLYPVHFPGYMERGDWAKRQRDALHNSEPSYLLVSRRDWTGSFSQSTPPFDVDLLRRWHGEYSTVIYENRLFQLLGRPVAMSGD